jgi:hypothetical protein
MSVNGSRNDRVGPTGFRRLHCRCETNSETPGRTVSVSFQVAPRLNEPPLQIDNGVNGAPGLASARNGQSGYQTFGRIASVVRI